MAGAGTVPWKPAAQAAPLGPSTGLCALAAAPSSELYVRGSEKERAQKGVGGDLAGWLIADQKCNFR